jgi:hypothetical protein
MDTETDLYSILGIERTATASEIKSRYRFLCQAFHPDKFTSDAHRKAAEEDFKRIKDAYDVLSDPSSKSDYDHINFSGSHFNPPPHAPTQQPFTNQVPPDQSRRNNGRDQSSHYDVRRPRSLRQWWYNNWDQSSHYDVHVDNGFCLLWFIPLFCLSTGISSIGDPTIDFGQWIISCVFGIPLISLLIFLRRLDRRWLYFMAGWFILVLPLILAFKVQIQFFGIVISIVVGLAFLKRAKHLTTGVSNSLETSN